jgi:hypothetical protein
MRNAGLWLALAAALAACRRLDARGERAEESEIIALSVRTDPPGATVHVNRLARAWTTPCDVAHPALRRGVLDVTLSLEGYETVTRRVPYDGHAPALLEVRLAARTGTVVLKNAIPGSMVMIVRTPPEAASGAALAWLWSENEEPLAAALEKLPDAEAGHVADRLKELAAHAAEKVSGPAKKKLEAAAPGKEAVRVTHRAVADIRGEARLTDVTGTKPGHLLATRHGSPDLLVPDLRLDPRSTLTIDAVAARAPRPAPEAVPPAEAGARLRVTSKGDRVRVSAGGRVVTEVPTKPDEEVRLTVPRQKLLVEFLDAKTGAVTGSVEVTPEPEGPPEGESRVGQVQLVHRVYGVFVKLDPGLRLAPGEEIVIVREGREVARTRILRVTSGDETYPDGAALIRGDAPIRKGDEVRRPR